jgi:imidazolonepropionase-like amidohydrolase
MAHVDSTTMAWWRQFERPSAEAPSARARAVAEAHRAVVRRLAERGGRLLVGTDTPNPFMVPGFSLHEEIKALVAAGFSRAAVLAAATSGAARFLDRDASVGRIAPGYRADLVLTAEDPLVDLGTLRRPVGVMVAGRGYSRADLDRLVAER